MMVSGLAIGLIWRRLLGKLLLNSISEDASKFLAPHQFGVGVPRGSEIPLDRSNLQPDIIIPTAVRNSKLGLDVTVIHPLCVSSVKHASTTLDYSNMSAEKDKINKYAAICKNEDMAFTPLAVEYYGRWGPQALSFFTMLAKGVAVRSNLKFSSVLKDILRSLTFSLLRSNAKAVLARTA